MPKASTGEGYIRTKSIAKVTLILAATLPSGAWAQAQGQVSAFTTAEPPVRPSATCNGPHNFNVTNMHTHGLWVSPYGNSDNMLTRRQSGHEFHH